MPLPFDPHKFEQLLDPQEFAYNTGLALTGLSWKWKPEGWQVVIRANRRNGEHVYAMSSNLSNPVEGTKALLLLLESKHASSLWRKDKFA